MIMVMIIVSRHNDQHLKGVVARHSRREDKKEEGLERCGWIISKTGPCCG